MTSATTASPIEAAVEYAMEEAALRLVVDENFPLISTERVQFPDGEREVTVRDVRWLDRTRDNYKIFQEARARVSAAPSDYSTFQDTGALRKLIYLEDEQMYSNVPKMFCTDCPWTVEQLRKLSWKNLGAGRFSTSFHMFQVHLLAQGFRCQLIEQYVRNSEPVSGYDVVIGATGNY